MMGKKKWREVFFYRKFAEKENGLDEASLSDLALFRSSEYIVMRVGYLRFEISLAQTFF